MRIHVRLSRDKNQTKMEPSTLTLIYVSLRLSLVLVYRTVFGGIKQDIRIHANHT